MSVFTKSDCNIIQLNLKNVKAFKRENVVLKYNNKSATEKDEKKEKNHLNSVAVFAKL